MLAQQAEERLRAALNAAHKKLGNWRAVAALPEYSDPEPAIPFGTLAGIAGGRRVPQKWRRRLRVPEEGTVTVLQGEAVDGAVALRLQACSCGVWYVSNHPRRRRCFSCSPYGGKP